MILNPKTILTAQILTSPDYPFCEKEQLQPNGIDLRIRKVLKVPRNMHSPFRMYADGSKHVPDQGVCEGTLLHDGPAFVLERGYAYSVECYEKVQIPRNVAAMVYGRSTLHRNGVLCRAGVYDSGFNDFVGLMMFPFCDFWVEKRTRIAQIIFYKSDTSHIYDGQYGLKKGANLDAMY